MSARGRYYVRSAAGGAKYYLPQTLKPGELALASYTPNLVRARNQRKQYDLSDPYSDPGVLTLAGSVEAAHEDALSTLLTDIGYQLFTGVIFGRDSHLTPGTTRREDAVIRLRLKAKPDDDNATRALIEVQVTLDSVPDPGSLAAYW